MSTTKELRSPITETNVQFPFLRLPLEIRLHIYELLLWVDTPYVGYDEEDDEHCHAPYPLGRFKPFTRLHYKIGSPGMWFEIATDEVWHHPPPRIWQTNQQIRTESRGLYLSNKLSIEQGAEACNEAWDRFEQVYLQNDTGDQIRKMQINCDVDFPASVPWMPAREVRWYPSPATFLVELAGDKKAVRIRAPMRVTAMEGRNGSVVVGKVERMYDEEQRTFKGSDMLALVRMLRRPVWRFQVTKDDVREETGEGSSKHYVVKILPAGVGR